MTIFAARVANFASRNFLISCRQCGQCGRILREPFVIFAKVITFFTTWYHAEGMYRVFQEGSLM